MAWERVLVDVAATALGERSAARVLRAACEATANELDVSGGVTATLWRVDGSGVPIAGNDDPVEAMAASHPSLAWVLATELEADDGPELSALRDRNVAVDADTFAGVPWPAYCRFSLAHGVRSSITVAQSHGELALTFSLYAVRPRAFEQPPPMLTVFVSQVLTSVAYLAEFDDVRSEAGQLKEAIDSHAVVDQARGIVMHATGCSAEEAFAQLRAASQRSQVRLIDVARRVLDQHSHRLRR